VYKIELKFDELPDMKLVTDWCRETYGPGHYTITDENGKNIRKNRWRSTWTRKWDGSSMKRYLILFFEKEEHASWFAIRWA